MAKDATSGAVVALKKSRAPSKVKRPALEHEASVLQLLQRHPSIPEIYAYGRDRYFEYLAQELLGPSLENIVRKHGKLSASAVASVGEQILSAFEHLRLHNIVHRDVTTSNILTREGNPSSVYLIDFGLARPFVALESDGKVPGVGHKYIVGTTRFASVNAHKGLELNPRDDVESLAYCLLFALRGGLPWDYACNHGTFFSRMAQVMQRKMSCNGALLSDSEGLPKAFGDLLDHARGLGFTDTPAYSEFRGAFAVLRDAALSDEVNSLVLPTLDDGADAPLPSAEEPELRVSAIPECPVQVGQLIYIRLNARACIEGYSLRLDPDLWEDPELSSIEWATWFRPAVVLRTAFYADQVRHPPLHEIYVAFMSRGKLEHAPPFPLGMERLSCLDESSGNVHTTPEWPLDDTYLYVYPALHRFLCLPTEAPVACHWKFDPVNVQRLVARFPYDLPLFPRNEDEGYLMRMRSTRMRFMVDLEPLVPPLPSNTHDDEEYDWRWTYGPWVDQLKIARRIGWDADGGKGAWTRAPEPDSEDTPKPAPKRSDAPREIFSDTYPGLDGTVWQWMGLRGERSRSLTLTSSQCKELEGKPLDRCIGLGEDWPEKW
ncbi:kinase-like protein [Auriscalpium vulgare]|uniref:Kinase-like protein n=1 Tax=Auriscalpium vulgare TaxID=40419 RepID=A0ACB8RWM8_9AGAM|nr:kinase-like protein [Auriscalpium vulgare]